MVNKKTIIHLLSGGLDSVSLLYDLKNQGHNIQCLIVDYGQRHSREIIMAKRHANKCGALFTVMNLPNLGGMTKENWIVPNRNSIFISLAVNMACNSGADTVTIGANADDAEYFPDCRKSFLDAMNAAVRAAGYNVEICAPYLDMPKSSIAKLALRFGIRKDAIWTCYQPIESGPCGVCPACKKLSEAYKNE